MDNVVFYTASEVAKMLNITRQAVNKKIKLGQINGILLKDGWKISQEQIDEYINKKSILYNTHKLEV